MLTLFFFFFIDTAPTEIYPLSLPDSLPIYRAAGGARRLRAGPAGRLGGGAGGGPRAPAAAGGGEDRKSTRLNSSHANISYAVFCLKKKNNHANISFSFLILKH